MMNLEKLQNYALHGPYANLKQHEGDGTHRGNTGTAYNHTGGTHEAYAGSASGTYTGEGALPGDAGYVAPGAHQPGVDPPQTWSEFVAMDPTTFSQYGDDTLLNMARKLSGNDAMTMDEMKQYLPQYDEQGYRDIWKEGAQRRRKHGEAIAGFGMEKRTDLLSQAIAKDKSIKKGGFAATGNPMIDRQRQSAYRDINVSQEREWRSLLDDVWSTDKDIRKHREDYQQTWAERLLDYEEELQLESEESDS